MIGAAVAETGGTIKGQAADAEVLADPRTIATAGSSAGSFETRAPMNLKGISKPVAVAALVDAA